MFQENNTTTKHLEVTMSNNQIEQIKQFLHNEICERRDYSASKMCEEVLKFIEQMNNDKQKTWVNIYNTVNGFIVSKPYPTVTLALTKDEVPEGATFVTTIPTPTEETIQWDEYGNPKPIIGGGEITMGNNNPGNLNMTVLRNHITMYLDDIESYGTRKELADATDVLFDFVKYINALDSEQAMIDYNAMEEEWEMDNYNEMQQ